MEIYKHCYHANKPKYTKQTGYEQRLEEYLEVFPGFKSRMEFV